MTLYRKVGTKAVPWLGEPINNIRYPLNIENLWTDNDLNVIGLWRPIDEGAPPGVKVEDIAVNLVNDVIKIQYNTKPQVPEDYPLTARQLRLGLIRNNVALTLVTSAIANLPTQQMRDEANIYWEYSTTILWDHPMTQTLLALVGIPVANAEVMWLAAKDYEA